jgi:glutathione S-transferase
MNTPMTTPMLWVVIVIVLALAQFLAFGILVGRAREKYQVPAPAMGGNPIFERYFRVQMNTLELLVLFVPGIWLFAVLVSASGAAGLGAVYLVGRQIYLASYVRDPKKRALGFGLSSLPILVMLAGILIVAIGRLLGLLHA